MKYVFKIDGLDCENCANELEKELNKLDNVNKARISFIQKKMIIDANSEYENIKEKVEKTIKNIEPDVVISLKNNLTFNNKIYNILLSFILFILTFFISNIYIKLLLFVSSYLIVGFEILKKSFRNIRRGKIFDENFLMSIATIGAFIIGEYSEAVFVMLFYQVGELFQSYAVDKSRKSISNLMDLKSEYANLLKEDKEIKTDIDDIKVDDLIIVKPGEKIPVDCVIKEGKSLIDTMSLTGESIPRSVTTGDELLSGCVNQVGLLKCVVTKENKESTSTKILELIENAGFNKSKKEDFIAKFSRIYTPIVVILALIICIFPPLILKDSYITWLYRALCFLVVSCPCALVISIPLSFFGGIGACSRIGVLVKGSNYLEKLVDTKTIVCDKTGTLTKGVFEVEKINVEDNVKENELLKYACYAEYYSNHPISKSLQKYYNKKINNKIINNYQEIAGKGVKAVINKKQVLVGNAKLMNDNNVEFSLSNDIGTVLYVSVDNLYLGNIVINDKIKDESYKFIDYLKKENINNIVMLTGDKEEIANHVANELKITKTYCKLLPQDKVNIVKELKNNEPNTLIFIGDGINDAPVLAMSDVGISMGNIGSDAAIEASDIVIMNDDISKIPDLIKIAKKTMRIVKENIVFAISVKVIVLVLSALGIATMWESVFADVGVSVLAILNSLRMIIKK